jgi:Zn-dependent protease
LPKYFSETFFYRQMFQSLFQSPTQFLLIVIAFVIAVSIHEAAHATSAYFFGDPTAKTQGRMTINPLAHLDPLGTLFVLFVGFGWAKPVPINPRNFDSPRRDEALVAFAGPLSNFFQALIAFTLSLVFYDSLSEFFILFLKIFTQINLLLCVFNLLPLFPLDGEKIFGAFVPRKFFFQYEQLASHGPIILFGLMGLEIFFHIPILSTIIGFLYEKSYFFLLFLSQPFLPSFP